MSFAPRSGESSAAGASRETSASRLGHGMRQAPISSFISGRMNNSQSFELPSSSGRRQTGRQSTSSVVDLEELELSVVQSFDFETPNSGQGQQARDAESLAAGDLEEPTTSQTIDATDVFKSSKTHFIYQEAQHDVWMAWWEKTPGYRAYCTRHGGKKQIHWNSNARGAEIWKYYRQCASKSEGNLGQPGIECILCGAVLKHPAAVGTTSMHQHHKSIACKKVRQRNAIEDSSVPTLEELWRSQGTKTGNRKYTIDSSLPDGYDQAQFDRFFIEALLATNLPFNAANNAAFRRIFRYLRRDVMLPSPTAIRGRLQSVSSEVEGRIREEIPSNAKISIAADAWTSPNSIAFLGIVGYWITDDWELKEVLLGFEQIHGAHTGENMARIIGEILKSYGIESQLLGFTSDSASNNSTLASALADALSQLSIDWNCENNHIPCMAHVVQLVLGSFMDHLKIQSKGNKVPSVFKESYVDKVACMEPGFFKTVEKHRKLSIAVASSPQRREYFLDLQRGRIEHPITLICDVKTRWNSTLNMLERALRMKDFTREWIKEYQRYIPLWSTPSEWKQAEYILQVLEPIRFCTLWMSKTRGPTIHRVFEVYDMIFDHLDHQISVLENKRMRWKVDIREALGKAREKASKYYSKTENPRGLLMALGACLNPYSKLELFREWDVNEAEGSTSPYVESYVEKYRQLFIQYYNQHYRPRLETVDEDLGTTQARPTGFGRRIRHPTVKHTRPAERDECSEYLDSPPEVDYAASPNLDNSLYEPNILQYWKTNMGRFPNLARMARDILAVQGGSVGVERIFSMGRDVIPYRRNRLESKSIRATMIVKSYLREELKKDIAGLDPDADRNKLQDLIALCDYQSSIPDQESGAGGYISDDSEEGRSDICWKFVEHDGEKAFRRERGIQLPARQESSSKGKGCSDLVDEGDIHLGLEDDESWAENENDEYGYMGHNTSMDGELGSIAEGHDVWNYQGDIGPEDGGPPGEGTDVDESQAQESSTQREGELLRSRKRAGSNLVGNVWRQSQRRK